jgi:hypothetical protein
MANDLGTGCGPSLSGLVSGIVDDAQELIKQQLNLFRHEIQTDIQKTKEGALSLVLGAGIAFLGTILLTFMLVHLLNWSWPQLPLWGCYGIVGGVFIVGGGLLCYWGKTIFASFNPLTDDSAQALKENIQWITKAK